MKLLVHQIAALNSNSILFQNVTFELELGKVIVILGDNGAGKSTLLDILAGILSPWSGSIQWDQNTVSDAPSLFRTDKRHCSYLLQSVVKVPGISVESFVKMGFVQGHNARLSKDNDPFLVWKLKDQDIQALSGGEWRRVQLTQLWLQLKNFVLLDEPEASLDLTSRNILRKQIASAQNSKKHGFVVVTHDLQWMKGLNVEVFKLTRFGLVANHY